MCRRIALRRDGKHDGTVDILLTGCEVSLWVAEQFAADLAQVFPSLNIRCICSNKVLGLYGQDFTVAQTGYQFNEDSWRLEKSIVIIVSHSGGTFAPLAVSNLLKAFTSNIYVVTSEWDTQIGKQLRQLSTLDEFRPSIFSTNVGLRVAEPCSVSVVATHELLTQVLVYLMHVVRRADLMDDSGGSYIEDDISFLQHANRKGISALEDICGSTVTGEVKETDTSSELRRVGIHWSWHVLEGPVAWILTLSYVAGTVISGYPLFTGVATALGYSSDYGSWQTHVLLALDAMFYVFCPQLAMLAFRLVQRRPLLHRMTGRTVVIGDIPWVAQCVDAFPSKLFACSFSAASLTVMHGNPSDHLVHRLTHRVVRGTLLACGCPDGRLTALTSAENSVCLSVNQASSIQNIGVTCESMTIGHNNFKLPLTTHAVTLPTTRRHYLCEYLLQGDLRKSRNMSSSSLMGAYANIQREHSTVKASGAFLNKLKKAKDGAASPPADAPSGSKRLQKSQTTVANYGVIGQAFAYFPMEEEYYGQSMRARMPKVPLSRLIEEQILSMRLFESRVASLQRCVAFMVMFHAMGKRAHDFWPTVSFGLISYDMSRTHSIMRIATTASPVSGAEVRNRMYELAVQKMVARAKSVLLRAVRTHLSNDKVKRRLSLYGVPATTGCTPPTSGPSKTTLSRTETWRASCWAS